MEDVRPQGQSPLPVLVYLIGQAVSHQGLNRHTDRPRGDKDKGTGSPRSAAAPRPHEIETSREYEQTRCEDENMEADRNKRGAGGEGERQRGKGRRRERRGSPSAEEIGLAWGPEAFQLTGRHDLSLRPPRSRCAGAPMPGSPSDTQSDAAVASPPCLSPAASASFGGKAGQRFGARVKESVASPWRRRCSKAILICAHSHQCHSALLVSLEEHQGALCGTAVTNSNRYHFKIIGPAHCVWLKSVAGATLAMGMSAKILLISPMTCDHHLQDKTGADLSFSSPWLPSDSDVILQRQKYLVIPKGGGGGDRGDRGGGGGDALTQSFWDGALYGSVVFSLPSRPGGADKMMEGKRDKEKKSFLCRFPSVRLIWAQLILL
ncbi:hypothetical protein EYF80_008506 [Liparis tanakae]|uniref:Uncharacterized protein n=1 Tax=Liparis tanakae TaxID=230148 RepID=A0A4Z2IV72_9TELE|nr:hypothetical protein EYF80_008506 [Liparis tanakae]